MIDKIQKIKSLSRTDIKRISGGIVPPASCNLLCGGAGGVVSNTPGKGDICTPDRSLCCICR
ncbi:hypothetical protein QFZ37_003044 [Chryseobacterium ginsenosidimutans]|uniref:hypothetical protein n=1 Tax=Chryseobacterium ginsenosidimutans TaxID=687846 RepID=UPI002781DE92|nr:hypothetical protein [Chryseobacterium ginsenosidimutans]MDQ0594675.1 hypothetical protein [Chryseobacterium ginsenosidimutans]